MRVIPFFFLTFFLLGFTPKPEGFIKSAQNAHLAVWQIHNPSFSGSGTTVAVGSNYFLTNFHVFRLLFKKSDTPLDKMILSQYGNPRKLSIDTLVAAFGKYDLVLFKTKESVNDYLELAASFSPSQARELSAIGYPRGSFNTMKQNEKITYEDFLSFAVMVDQFNISGASGGSIVNPEGKLVGLVHSANGNLISGIKIEHLRKVINVDGKAKEICSQPSLPGLCLDEKAQQVIEAAKQGDILAQYQVGRNDSFIFSEHSKFTLDMLKEVAGSGSFLSDAHIVHQFRELDGFPPAAHSLGVVYDKGLRGVARDLKLAFQWYHTAAQRGHIRAQTNAAILAYTGEGTGEQNFVLAFQLFEMAAEQGDVLSQYNAGIMCLEGQGTDQSTDQARYFFNKAAKQGHPLARRILRTL